MSLWTTSGCLRMSTCCGVPPIWGRCWRMWFLVYIFRSIDKWWVGWLIILLSKDIIWNYWYYVTLFVLKQYHNHIMICYINLYNILFRFCEFSLDIAWYCWIFLDVAKGDSRCSFQRAERSGPSHRSRKPRSLRQCPPQQPARWSVAWRFESTRPSRCRGSWVSQLKPLSSWKLPLGIPTGCREIREVNRPRREWGSPCARYAVEFQKRGGDSVAFNQAFRQAERRRAAERGGAVEKSLPVTKLLRQHFEHFPS